MANPLQALRDRMAEYHIDAYLIPTADFHGSEYVGDHFACRRYVSGFTGSAGTLLVFPHWAGLWTDGRYFLQAEAQLQGSGIRLMKMGQPGVPTIEGFLRSSLQPGQTLGFDGRCVDARTGRRYHQLTKQLGAKMNHGDLAGPPAPLRPAGLAAGGGLRRPVPGGEAPAGPGGPGRPGGGGPPPHHPGGHRLAPEPARGGHCVHPRGAGLSGPHPGGVPSLCPGGGLFPRGAGGVGGRRGVPAAL